MPGGRQRLRPGASPGSISAHLRLAGPDATTTRRGAAYYANNLVGGGAEPQQKSNGAFFKNSRVAIRKLKRPPKTAKNMPGASEKDRYGKVSGPGVDGNPKSKAKNFVSVDLK